MFKKLASDYLSVRSMRARVTYLFVLEIGRCVGATHTTSVKFIKVAVLFEYVYYGAFEVLRRSLALRY
jgi:hypothetical protein